MSGALYAPLIFNGDLMEEILIKGFEELGVPVPEGAIANLRGYYDYLTERNAVMDLTAIKGEENTARMHFLDCCALLTVTGFAAKPYRHRLGRGFPRPAAENNVAHNCVTCAGTLKPVRLRGAHDGLASKAEQTVCAGWPEEAPLEMRESYDIATSRAVAKLNLLLELCLPFVHTGGVFLAMKGPDCDAEAAEAANAAGQLGGKIREIKRYTVPGTDVVHACVVVDKLSPTPPQFPRRWARMQKKPL